MTADELKTQLNLGLGGFGKGSELKEIANMLTPDEKVGKGANGVLDGKAGVLVATDKRVIFVSKIMFTSKIEEFGYSKISTVQVDSALVTSLVITFSGSKIKISSMNRTQAAEIANYIKAQMNHATQPATTTVVHQTVNQADPMDQLVKLAQLKEQGIITEDEFAAKKKQLLGL